MREFTNSYPQVDGRECYPTAGEWLSNVGVQEGKLLAENGDASNHTKILPESHIYDIVLV